MNIVYSQMLYLSVKFTLRCHLVKTTMNTVLRILLFMSINRKYIQDRGLSDNESEGMESELIEALGREARLKERLQGLISTLDEVNKNSELRHQQSAELVNDLKRANG